MSLPDTPPTFDLPGFPNVLLKGVGEGRFVQVEGAPGSPGSLLKNTFSGSFSDFDGDGDQDLFCANDFSSDNLFRNDDGVFVDVTEQMLGTGPRFGMGGSWGDYNGDGRMDAYVSNMFSKAGNRIISQIDPEMVDARLLPTAQGNTLLANRGDHFEPVSDTDTTVSKSGWSYGSQFADVDGDGVLDILGLSGHFTAPDPLPGAYWASASTASWDRAQKLTSAPWSARSLTTASPIPKLAPVTTARFPVKSRSIMFPPQVRQFLPHIY